jgi:hypothetical protein
MDTVHVRSLRPEKPAVKLENIIRVEVLLSETPQKTAKRPGSKWSHGNRPTLKQKPYDDTEGFVRGVSVKSLTKKPTHTSKDKS